ncbi:MAG: hypothetical protein ACP5US_10945 [Candidatus Kryptoniota bacterium]
MIHLKLQIADGKFEVISPGNLTYQEHQELKPQLRMALESHGLLKVRSIEVKQIKFGQQLKTDLFISRQFDKGFF